MSPRKPKSKSNSFLLTNSEKKIATTTSNQTLSLSSSLLFSSSNETSSISSPSVNVSTSQLLIGNGNSNGFVCDHLNNNTVQLSSFPPTPILTLPPVDLVYDILFSCLSTICFLRGFGDENDYLSQSQSSFGSNIRLPNSESSYEPINRLSDWLEDKLTSLIHNKKMTSLIVGFKENHNNFVIPTRVIEAWRFDIKYNQTYRSENETGNPKEFFDSICSEVDKISIRYLIPVHSLVEIKVGLHRSQSKDEKPTFGAKIEDNTLKISAGNPEWREISAPLRIEVNSNIIIRAYVKIREITEEDINEWTNEREEVEKETESRSSIQSQIIADTEEEKGKALDRNRETVCVTNEETDHVDNSFSSLSSTGNGSSQVKLSEKRENDRNEDAKSKKNLVEISLDTKEKENENEFIDKKEKVGRKGKRKGKIKRKERAS